MEKETEVVAALIWRWENGCRQMLVGKRPAHKARGGLWEFVGGKTEPGETPEEALVRECREELDVTVTVGGLFTEVLHRYDDLTVRLKVFHAEIAEGTPKPLEHQELAWITPPQIPDWNFCPADVEILRKIDWETDWITPGVYEHFKGNRYEVLGISRHSETLEQLVVYRALYGDEKLWVRPAKLWVTPAEKDGGSVARFRYLHS